MCELDALRAELINAFYRTEAIPSPQCDSSAPFAVAVGTLCLTNGINGATEEVSMNGRKLLHKYLLHPVQQYYIGDMIATKP